MSRNKENLFSHFAYRIKYERERLELNQAKAGEICGVSREMWGRYERGTSTPNCKVLFAFAQAGANIQYIFNGSLIEDTQPSYENLRPDQAALLNNLEHCSKEDQDAIKRMALIAARATDKDETQPGKKTA